VLFEVTAHEKIIALSIDDAPSTFTDGILDVLDENEARATFFVIGGQVAGREKILRRIIRRGNELGNHAMRDEPSKNLSNEELKTQVDEVEQMLDTAYRAEGLKMGSKFFRPGSGFFDDRMRRLLAQWGYRITLGSVYPHDPQIPYYSVNARHILSMAHPGAIIICHDRRGWTVPMLKIVLPELRKRGYRIVSISTLIASTRPSEF
jgi:peptidoglycan/xylan/chitin deacetylase (PgdA/CDA1 family)